MPAINISTGIRVAYELHGPAAAEPLVLIRGLSSPGERWMPQVAEYSRFVRCATFDNRGCGGTDAPRGPYTIELLAADTIGLMDALGIKRAHVAGMSLGGAVAQRLAIDHPSRVISLQLHSSWGRTAGYVEHHFRTRLRLLLEAGSDLYADTAIMFLVAADAFAVRPERVRATLAGMKESRSLSGTVAQIEAILGHDALDELPLVSCPTLITVGERDAVMPPLYSRQLRDAIPQAELVEFPGGSHFFSSEDVRTFNHVTARWLRDRIGAGTASAASA
jgi:pimeloyl-ACP methyl ester carboxylesterase